MKKVPFLTMLCSLIFISCYQTPSQSNSEEKNPKQIYADSIIDSSFFGIKLGDHIESAHDSIVKHHKLQTLNTYRNYSNPRESTDEYSGKTLKYFIDLDFNNEINSAIFNVKTFQDTVYAIVIDVSYLTGFPSFTLKELVNQKYGLKYGTEYSSEINYEEKYDCNAWYSNRVWDFKNVSIHSCELLTSSGNNSVQQLEYMLIYYDKYHYDKYLKHKGSILEEEQKEQLEQEKMRNAKNQAFKDFL